MGAPLLDNSTHNLTEVQIVGSRYVYTCDGEEITEAQYRALREAVRCPVVETLKFDTADGKLANEQYFIDNGVIKARLEGFEDIIPISENIKGATFRDETLRITNRNQFEAYAKD